MTHPRKRSIPQAPPTPVRLSLEEKSLIALLAREMGTSKHDVHRRALRLGLAALQNDGPANDRGASP